jgi:HK97 family phage major capsid protein
MSNIDSMLSHYKGELDEKQAFLEQLFEKAQKDGRDLNPNEVGLSERVRGEMAALHEQLDPMLETQRIAQESAKRLEAITKIENRETREPSGALKGQYEYRSAGEYICDYWQAGLGLEEATKRIKLYHRAAAHQTTADNPGLIPTPIVGPVVNFVDSNRPLVNFLGPNQLPGWSFSRPKVTQHTTVAAQSAEKAELASQKMTVGKIAAAPTTLGGYVNVSRQDADYTQPAIMDVLVSDLAAQYAVLSESNAATTFDTAATAGLALPTGANTADQLAASLWDAASKIYTATKGAGRFAAFMPPAMLASIGPVFPPVPAVPSQAPTGFSAGDFKTGYVGNISGIPIYVSAGIGASRILVISTAGAEVYEDRIGALSVTEPSVLGIQLAYAGYFCPLVVEGTAIIKITKTP